MSEMERILAEIKTYEELYGESIEALGDADRNEFDKLFATHLVLLDKICGFMYENTRIVSDGENKSAFASMVSMIIGLWSSHDVFVNGNDLLLMLDWYDEVIEKSDLD